MSLSDGMSWRTYEGRTYVYVDYRGKTQEEMMALLTFVADVFKALPPYSGCVVDFRGVSVGREYMMLAKRYNSEIFGPRQLRVAILGVDGLKRILLNGYNKVFNDRASGVAFATEHEAVVYAAHCRQQ